MRIELLTHQERSCLAVDDFVAVKAHDFNKAQQTSTSRLQQVQHQSLGINKIQQISISSGIWFGTRCSTRKSYSEVLHFQQTHLAHLLKVVEVDGNRRLRQLHFRLHLRKQLSRGLRTTFLLITCEVLSEVDHLGLHQGIVGYDL